MAFPPKSPASYTSRWHWLWLVLPLAASAWSRGLWAPDEPRYAEVAREIHESGDWLVLHLCGEVYPDKPPLLYWLAGAAGRATGWNEGAMRLVSIVSACATAWLCGVLARRWWGSEEGRAAPAFFLGTWMVTMLGGRLQIDPLLAALCTWSLVEIDAASRAGQRATPHLLRAGLACGLGALAKGPVAFANVGFVAIAWSFLPRESPRPRRAWVAVAIAVLLAIAPVLVWALLASAREPALAHELFFGQHVGRAVEGNEHPGPFWKHLVDMPVFLMPWTLLVVLGLARAWRSFRTRADGVARDEGLWRAASWLLVLLFFFSALPTKRDLYLLAAYPAAALLAARWLATACRAESFPRRVVWSVILFFAVGGVLLALAGPMAWIMGAEKLGGIEPAAIGWRSLVPAALFLLGAWACARSTQSQKLADWARAAWVTWAVGTAALILMLCPLVDPVKSARRLGEWLAARPERPAAIPCLGVQPEGYRFYGRVPAVRDDDLTAALERDGADFLGLVNEREYDALAAKLRASTSVLHRARVGSRDILVLGAERPGKEDAETGTAER